MNSPLLVIIAAAMVAGAVLFRLYTQFGRRTGEERPPEQYRFPGADRGGDNVLPMPPRPARAETLDRPLDPLSRGLFDIQLADRKFDQTQFLAGAKIAYERVVTAFAKGDRATLRPLLSEEVFSAFDGVMRTRERQHERVEFTFIGITAVRVAEAVLRQRVAEITVSFAANYLSATYKADGTLLEGDPKAVRAVDDVWTFSRDIRSGDPNWVVIATHGDDAA